MVADSVASLFKPLRLGAVTVPNRIQMAALTRSRSVPTNVPNSINLEHYQQRAKYTALIITEATLVSQQGTEWQNAPGIWSSEQVKGWKKIVDAVHSEGGLIFCQLWHTGRVSHPDAPEQKASGKPVYAPSAIAARGGKFRFIEGVPGYVTPTEMPDPREAIDLFKQAAINAKNAGFDGIELHGANGYLIHQFLDSSSNQRTDDWGGSAEKRCRFALDLLKELVGIFGPYKVGIKLSPCGGYNDMGMSVQETVETFGCLLTEADKLPLAWLKLVRPLADFMPIFDGVRRGLDIDVITTFKPFIKSTPLVINGGLSPSEASRLIEEGKADAAEFGRLFISHPDFVKRVEHGKPLDTNIDFVTLYGLGNSVPYEEQKQGYNDYPEAIY